MAPIDPITVYPLEGLPEVRPGDDLPRLMVQALAARKMPLRDGDVVVVAQKVVSKAEGSRVALAAIEPSPYARRWAERWGKDPRMVELVLRESRRIVRMERGVIIAETHHGYVCANAGVDLSNSGAEEFAILLPEDCDRSAAVLRDRLRAHCGKDGADVELAVIVADTFGRPWRVGLTQVALGVAGLAPLVDYRDTPDVDGRQMHATVIAVADELACVADLVCGKTRRVPAAIVRGYPLPKGEGNGGALIRAAEMDLFR